MPGLAGAVSLDGGRHVSRIVAVLAIRTCSSDVCMYISYVCDRRAADVLGSHPCTHKPHHRPRRRTPPQPGTPSKTSSSRQAAAALTRRAFVSTS